MLSLLVVVQVILGFILVGLILIQKGKGAEMGVSFGAGAADTLFGPTGAMSLLAKITWVLAFLFMLNSIGISYMVYKSNTSSMVPSTPATQTQAPSLPSSAKPITK
ncbi:preprotein translocase subunit SecG [Hippea alviniae]|uniref:preprotein translocase subunit SecG n=1 Tax=Hippea alviniae TaxID=1279027 RepID=UPI0003B64C79|nr:preprotein translocase subunit SecG [Hippea alviniae]